MTTLKFQLRDKTSLTVEHAKEDSKLLAIAIRSGIDIRYGCSAGKCGTCAVRVVAGDLEAMRKGERELLEKMGILDGEKIRLSCRIRVPSKELSVDLSFQDEYDPAELGF